MSAPPKIDFNKFNSRRKLFYPAGPISARHTKKQEWLIPSGEGGASTAVWSKSGPPTHESRYQKGEVVKPLLHPDDPQRQAQRACVEIRRDLNQLVKQKGGRTGAGLILQPEFKPPLSARGSVRDEDEHADDLWESLEHSSLSDARAIFAESIARTNRTRSMDAEDKSARH
eukprot:TRINITY_DN113589_c0_g1_i1.p1 TRINITY_DN113589_c0_g1~~TRINITY_DN113589_c0_g1_i1.p1  ORF type:complete len:182 (+),score=36.16 TRINITY_DN113589_c0_g1_i1:34-546(+)